MGKGRDKRKKAAQKDGDGRNKAKNDKKAREKNLQKKTRRALAAEESDEDMREEDIEMMLEQYKRKELKKKEVIVEECAPPSERINATLVGNPVAPGEMILFGGEYWNGEKTDSYNDLFRFNVEKAAWRSVSSPTTPSPRSSHQTVTYKNLMITFGGEFTSPSQTQFHHHGDLWRLDCNTFMWEELKIKGKAHPMARSGHRMILWRRSAVLFGGFHDTLTTSGQYFNDVWILSGLDGAPTWTKIETQGEAPTKRSAVSLAVHNDTLFLYGGFSVDGKGGVKGFTHSDLWALNLSAPSKEATWQRVKKQGIPPTVRSGMSVTVHGRKAIFFGGVADYDEKEDIKSRFFNDMYVFDMETRRWFPMLLRKRKKAGAAGNKGGGKRRRRGGGAKDDDEAGGDLAANLAALESTAPAPAPAGRAGSPAGEGAAAAAAAPVEGDAATEVDDLSDLEDDLENAEEEFGWNRHAMPALPKAKKKAKMDKAAREAAVKARIEAEEDAASGKKKKGKTSSSADAGHATAGVGGAGRATAGAVDGAPPGMQPIYMGNDIIGWLPIDKPGEGKKDEPEAVPAATGEEDDEFTPAEAYAGSKPGFVFKMGAKGCGYYRDAPPQDLLTQEQIDAEKKKAAEEKSVHFDATAKEQSRNTYTANADGQHVPCGRFSSLMTTVGNYMYLYGGQFEEGSREVTLSDMFRLNMNTLDTFEVVQEMDLSKQDWYESEEEDGGDDDDEDEDEEEGGRKGKKGKKKKKHHDSDSDEEDEESGDDSDDDEGSEGSDAPELEAKGTASKKKGRVRNKRDELRLKLGADEGVPTPEPHQALRDFFSASLQFWTQEATSSADSFIDPTATDRAKAIRREAFRLSSVRYHEIEYLDQLEKQEAEWRAKKAAEAKEHDVKMKKLLKKSQAK